MVKKKNKSKLRILLIDNLFNKPPSTLRNAKKNTANHCALCGKKKNKSKLRILLTCDLFKKPPSTLRNVKKNTASHCVLCG